MGVGRVSNPNRNKGLAAEREAASLIGDHLGYDVHRLPSPGSSFEVGDLFGIPGTVVQVAYWPSKTLAAYTVKPDEAEVQRERAGATFAATMIRHKGYAGRPALWRVALTVPQFAALWREATTGSELVP